MDGCEEVLGGFVVAGCNGLEVFELIEEALDQIAAAMQEGRESRFGATIGYRLDVGEGTVRGELPTQRIGIIGSISEQDVAVANGNEHVYRGAAIMGLAFGELERDRQAAGVDQRVDFWSSGRPASDPCNGIGPRFWVLGAC